jgi:hypothetical protein
MKRDISAWIALDDDFARRECRLVDVSEHGARLVVDSSTPLPHDFRVALVPNAPARPCEKVWRNGSMVGIKFKS